MKYFFGPFIGEFGWELLFWQAWIRNIKQKYLSNHEVIVSSFPGRQPLYEFADKFIPLPDSYLENNFSSKNYFLDWEHFNEDQFLNFKNEIKLLMKHYSILFKNENIKYIYNFPQKIYTRKLNYRIQNYVSRKIFKNKINNFEEYLEKVNIHPGKNIKSPLFLNYPYKYNSIDSYNVQFPLISNQSFIKLKSTKYGIKLRNEILKNYEINGPIFCIFPRFRNIRRPDKNWTENNWIKFISLLVKKYNALIVICGYSNESFFKNSKNSKNIINILNYDKKISLDLQLAFLEISKVAVHGRSGSCYLSMLSDRPTFMAGPEIDRKIITIDDNVLNSNIKYFTDYDVNPPPEIFFTEFNEYYNELYI